MCLNAEDGKYEFIELEIIMLPNVCATVREGAVSLQVQDTQAGLAMVSR